jgi:hypothetical protein
VSEREQNQYRTEREHQQCLKENRINIKTEREHQQCLKENRISIKTEREHHQCPREDRISIKLKEKELAYDLKRIGVSILLQEESASKKERKQSRIAIRSGRKEIRTRTEAGQNQYRN